MESFGRDFSVLMHVNTMFLLCVTLKKEKQLPLLKVRFNFQHKELATLYRLRQLFVKDLQARLKVVS